jgi:glucosamine--fructose-6-phosphate aminotransferase (isomerizing)
MCGISVFISKCDQNILVELLASLYQLQNRGYDSAGIAYLENGAHIDDSTVNIVKYASTVDLDSLECLNNEINNNNNNNNIKSYCAIGHTRWATHGGKTDLNSHPHMSNSNNFILVHNGIIENYLELKNFLKDEGYHFKSETDTEVIVNLIEYYYLTNLLDYESPTKTCIKLACERLRGTWALAIMDVNDKNTIYITRNGSPLLIGENDNMIICSSEMSGFCNNVTNYMRLENNNIIKIKNGVLNKGELINTKQFKVNITENNSLTPDPYPHWTVKEIFEQSSSIMRAINNGGRIYNNQVKLGGLYNLLPFLNKIDNIILLGCGTSLHACMLGEYYLNERTDFRVFTYDAAEITENSIPKYDKNLIIYCSQSGETRDLYKNIELSRKYDCINLGIVNVTESLIANEVDCGVYMNAGREVAVASTKSFTSTLIILSLISILFSQCLNKERFSNSIYNTNGINDIENLRILSSQVEKQLYDKEFLLKCDSIRDIIINTMRESKDNSIFILGKGKMYPIAKEAALKIKEITYIHAEGYSGGALKHGPFALLNDTSIVILLIDEKNKSAMFNTYEEIKSRGAYCFIVSELDIESNIGNIDLDKKERKTHILKIQKNSSYQEILTIVALQYLAYIISLAKGINPDRPKNLAKVVTVE